MERFAGDERASRGSGDLHLPERRECVAEASRLETDLAKDGKAELFNIANDPYEKNDLAASEPEQLARLEKLIQAERAKDEPKLPADLVGLPK